MCADQDGVVLTGTIDELEAAGCDSQVSSGVGPSVVALCDQVDCTTGISSIIINVQLMAWYEHLHD